METKLVQVRIPVPLVKRIQGKIKEEYAETGERIDTSEVVEAALWQYLAGR